jgi:hypothetical protein
LSARESTKRRLEIFHLLWYEKYHEVIIISKERNMTPLSLSSVTYRTIRERIITLEADIDEQTLADTLEGLTDFPEVVAAVIRAALFDEALAEGLKGHIQTLEGRLQRLKERADARRRIARDAMVEVDLKKITAPDFTVSVKAGAPALVVVDAASVPAAYWVPREPRLDRAGLLSDLKNGLVVAGAELANPVPVLSVRVR